jgi:hypothetical protein
MAVRMVSINVTGSSAELQKALADAGLAAEDTGDKVGEAMSAGADKASSAFAKLAEVGRTFGIPFVESLDAIGDKLEETDVKAEGFGGKMADLGKGLALGVGAAVVAIGYESIKMADQFDTAQANLQVAIKATGSNFDALKPKLNDAYSAMAKVGFNSTDTATALTGLTTATDSPTRAMGLLSTAADLARFKNESLTDASATLQKVLAGNTRVLTQMGINLDVGTGKLASIQSASESLAKAQLALKNTTEGIADGSIKAAQAQTALAAAHLSVSDAAEKLKQDQDAVSTVMDALRQKTEGAANAFGNTLAGKTDVAKAELHNLGTELGERLIPILTQVISVTMDIVEWFAKHQAAAIALATIVGGVVVAAIGAFVISLFTAEGALAFLIGPVGIVIAAIAALGAAAYLLATHWKEVWTDIKNWFDDAVSFLRSGFGTFVVLLAGPLAPLVELGLHWQTVWGTVKSVVSDAWSFIKPIFDAIVDGVKAVTGAIKDVTGAIGSIAHVGGSIIGGAVSGLASLNPFADGGPIPGSTGHPVPILAHGGEFMLSHAMVQGNDPSWIKQVPGAAAAAAKAGGGGSTTHQSITINGTNLADPIQTASEVGWTMRTLS